MYREQVSLLVNQVFFSQVLLWFISIFHWSTITLSWTLLDGHICHVADPNTEFVDGGSTVNMCPRLLVSLHLWGIFYDNKVVMLKFLLWTITHSVFLKSLAVISIRSGVCFFNTLSLVLIVTSRESLVYYNIKENLNVRVRIACPPANGLQYFSTPILLRW